MKLFRLIGLLVATAMFLVACGTSGGDTTTEQGSLTVVVNTDGVTINVTGNGVDETATVNDSRTWNVDPGTYTVTAAKDGWVTADGDKTAVVTAGENTPVAFSFSLASSINGNPASVTFSAFTDEQGASFPTVDDPAKDNDADKTVIVAAQQQDNVCVEVTVLNEDGDPLRNAPVDFDAVDTSDFVVTGGAGCSMSNAADSVDGIVTNQDGKAYFYVRGAMAPDVNNFSDAATEPASVNVTVRGSGDADSSTATQEFRAWFIDMTHLHYVEANLSGTDYVWTTDSKGNLEDVRAAETRLGDDFGTIVNVWNDEDLSKNAHSFDSIAKVRSTDAGPYQAGWGLSGTDGYFTAAFNASGDVVVADVGTGTTPSSTGFSGFMLYALSGGDTDSVEWDGCHAVSTDGLTCIDDNSGNGDSGVSVAPKSSIAKEDLPLEVEITATYYFVVEFAGGMHALPLKDYTYTKRWVGAYLGIDKYVDQHVLTWMGPEVTIDRSTTTGSTIPDYLKSTVNIIVTNPSNAPLYDVFVIDGVPPEFGVVIDSISNGGTYDADNHAVTWNSQDLPEFQEFANGAAPVVLTFDVYARQKPGFCWEGTDVIEDYVVDRLDADVISDTDTFVSTGDVDQYCYGDPYMVTNGDESRSVVASGWPEADYDINTDQVSFYYSPREDESDIWVVRPLMQLTKVLNTEPVMIESEVATFTIEATSVDRANATTGEAAYKSLAAKYPWEFGGALGTGTGHQADGSLVSGSTTASEARVNPYLDDVQVYDAFEIGLDFSQAQDFDGSIFTSSSTKVEDKDITFTTFDLTPGEKKSAVVKLTGDLPSAEQSGTDAVAALKNANKFVSDTNEFFSTTDKNIPAWMNCAYLDADQLNQPSHTDSVAYTVYNVSPTSGTVTWWGNEPWNPPHVELVSDTNAVSLVDSTLPVYRQFDNAGGMLEACATVAVAESPDLGINVRGEFFVSDSDLLSGSDTYTTVSQVDILEEQETFTYIFSIETAGGQIIKNAQFEIQLENDRTVFTGTSNDIAFIESDDEGATWAASGAFTVGTFDADTLTFTADALPNDMMYRIGVAARADRDGQNNTTFTATYTNNSSQDLPLESTDSTTVTD